MSLEAQLWREVGRHLDLQESLERIVPLLAARVALDRLLVRRWEPDAGRLVTVAAAATGGDVDLGAMPARTECDPQARALVRDWLLGAQPLRLDSARATPMHRALVPSGLEGAGFVGPLRVGGAAVAVALFWDSSGRARGPGDDAQVALALEPLSVAFENDQRLHEVARMRAALEADRDALLSRLGRQDISDVVIGSAGGLMPVMERVEQVAPTDAPVLILGETGSGKEVIARAIHTRSRRAKGPVVRVNCGAIPSELIDSELFGHERGSFTGAVGTRKGWFERADGGTLFLDEIGELPLAAQVRLLRVLQDGSLERVGGHQPITVDVRLVTATHRHLETMVGEGRFREDLWYRISVFPIRLPALRERAEDIPALAGHFARGAGLRLGAAPLVPTPADVELLRRYSWPGNVRELAAVIERAAILGNGVRLEIDKALGGAGGAAAPLPGNPSLVAGSMSVPPTSSLLAVPPGNAPLVNLLTMNVPSVSPPTVNAPLAGPALAAVASSARRPAPLPSLDQAMAEHIQRALTQTHGRIEGPFGAAQLLGVNPHTLRARMRKLGIAWKTYRARGPAPR